MYSVILINASSFKTDDFVPLLVTTVVYYFINIYYTLLYTMMRILNYYLRTKNK
jgi:hypothetical protein